MKILVATAIAFGFCFVGCSKLGGGGKTVPGVVTAYQPVTYYDHIRRDCGPGCKLLKMEAKNVSSDGTMDLTGDALVRYEFRNSNSTSKSKLEKVIITVPKVGGSRRPDKITMDRATRPYNTKINRATTAVGPKCKLSELWQAALGKGAGNKDVATVTYDQDGYLFEIKGKNVKLRFDKQCKLAWAPSKLVKPVKDYPGVASLAPEGAELTGLTARQVRSDGTADTSSDPAWVRYTFHWTAPLKRAQEVQIWLRGGDVRIERKEMTLGAKPNVIAPPKCAFSDLWQTALQNKASKDQTAQITYEGKSYSFRQESPRLSLEFDAECKLKK